MFKIHISKWIKFILNDVTKGIITETAKENTKEEACLSLIKELLKDNEFIVNNFVSD